MPNLFNFWGVAGHPHFLFLVGFWGVGAVPPPLLDVLSFYYFFNNNIKDILVRRNEK
jgi:hypothetical protein